jgi:hypothetical protein
MFKFSSFMHLGFFLRMSRSKQNLKEIRVQLGGKAKAQRHGLSCLGTPWWPVEVSGSYAFGQWRPVHCLLRMVLQSQPLPP